MASDDSKAEILWCMDVIMHHLNNEDELMRWLSIGVPDDARSSGVTDCQRKEMSDLDIDDKSFEYLVELFVKTLARELMPGMPSMSGYKVENEVFV